MQRGDKLAFAGNLLIEACAETQKIAQEFRRDKQFSKEFCTVRLGSSRRAGHDYASARIIRDNFKSVIYVSSSQPMSAIAKNECKAIGIDHRVVWATPSHLRSGFTDGLDAEAVIVNSASSMTKDVLDSIYELTLPNLVLHDPKFWILIG
jgi:hypothetical protein